MADHATRPRLIATPGIGIWSWAGNEARASNPTLSWPAPAMCRRWKRWLRSIFCDKALPELKIRVVNVVDLMTLQPKDQHPHGISDSDFDGMFTRDKPVIFAYHGYPYLIHRLTYNRTNHSNMHVHGFEEEGTTTTPFDMVVLNRTRSISSRDRRHRPRARACAFAPRTSSSTSATSCLNTRVMSGSTARTCPKSGTGSGLARQAPKQAADPPAPSQSVCQVRVSQCRSRYSF